MTSVKYVQPVELLPHPLNTRVYGKEILEPGFVESIRVKGVHEPVVVISTVINSVAGLYILSGHRRVKAAERVGRTVPIRLVDDADTLWQESYLLESNRQREKTPEQKAREFIELKRIEAALAKERQGTRTDIKANLPECSKGQARDKASAKVGMKPRNAEKLEKLVKAADAGDAIARAALDEVNAGKKSVHAAAKEAVSPQIAQARKTGPDIEAEEYQERLVKVFGVSQVKVASSCQSKFGFAKVAYGRFKVTFLIDRSDLKSFIREYETAGESYVKLKTGEAA